MVGFGSRAAGVAEEALARLGRGAAVVRHLRTVDPRRLPQLAVRVHLTLRLLRDVARGAYPRLPWKTVAALAAALAYFVAPIDAVPDVIPLSGFLDDAAVFGLVFAAAEADLRAYCLWRGLDPRRYFDA